MRNMEELIFKDLVQVFIPLERFSTVQIKDLRPTEKL